MERLAARDGALSGLTSTSVPWSSTTFLLATPTPPAVTPVPSSLVLKIDNKPVATVTVVFSTPAVLEIPPHGEILQPAIEKTMSKEEIVIFFSGETVLFRRLPKADGQLSPTTTAPTSSTAIAPPSIPPTTASVGTDASAISSSTLLHSGTATTSSSASKSTSKPTNSGTGLSVGATAGIAVGCLAAGALLAALILWFCWRKRRAPKSEFAHANTYAMTSQEKGFSAKTMPLVGAGHTAAALGSGIPQPLEDKAISADISKISNAIKNHVQSYYHTNRLSSGLVDYDDLHALGQGMPISVGTLTTLMANAATREIVLRFIIAWVVVLRMKPSKDPSKSLLPPEVAQCYNTIATGDRGFQAQASLMVRWRVMSAELMQANYVRKPFTPSDSRHASIRATFMVLDSVLQPYADSRMNNEERKRNLEEVLKRSALFAFTLFSQPSTWEFEWQEEHGVTSGELCIFPALVQVTDENGQPVNPPRPFSEAVVRRLDT